MELDVNILRGISTVLVMAAFLGVCFWAYSSKRKPLFDEAENIPFADEDNNLDVSDVNSRERGSK